MSAADRLAALAGTIIHSTTLPYTSVTSHSHTAGLARYAQSFGDGVLTSITITHNLGTVDVSVQVYENATGLPIIPLTMTRTSASVVTMTFTLAPTSNQYRIIVIG